MYFLSNLQDSRTIKCHTHLQLACSHCDVCTIWTSIVIILLCCVLFYVCKRCENTDCITLNICIVPNFCKTSFSWTFLNNWKMSAITVYILVVSKIMDPGYQACLLLYKFGHWIVLNEDVKVLKSAYTETRANCPATYIAQKHLFVLPRSRSTSWWTWFKSMHRSQNQPSK